MILLLNASTASLQNVKLISQFQCWHQGFNECNQRILMQVIQSIGAPNCWIAHIFTRLTLEMLRLLQAFS